METRSQARARRSEPDRFEKTVNLLLTQCRRIGKYTFELRVDKPFADPQAREKRLLMINVKERADKKKSRPDAELISKESGLYFVIDAKFYQGPLSGSTIDKTLDDMKLRKAYGLIVCNEDAQLSSSLDINFQKEIGNLQIFKIKPIDLKSESSAAEKVFQTNLLPKKEEDK